MGTGMDNLTAKFPVVDDNMIQDLLTYMILGIVAATFLYRVYRFFKGRTKSAWNCKRTGCPAASDPDKEGAGCSCQL